VGSYLSSVCTRVCVCACVIACLLFALSCRREGGQRKGKPSYIAARNEKNHMVRTMAYVHTQTHTSTHSHTLSTHRLSTQTLYDNQVRTQFLPCSLPYSPYCASSLLCIALQRREARGISCRRGAGVRRTGDGCNTHARPVAISPLQPVWLCGWPGRHNNRPQVNNPQ